MSETDAIQDRTLGHRAPLLWLVLPFMAGLAAARLLPGLRAAPLLAAALVAGTVSLLASRRRPAAGLAALALAMALAGHGNGILHQRPAPRGYPAAGRWTSVRLRIERAYPQRKPGRAGGLAVILGGGRGAGLRGLRAYYSVAVRDGGAPPIRGETVSASGLLSPVPAGMPADTFDGSLEAQGIALRLQRGRLGARLGAAPAAQRVSEELANRMSERLGLGLERWPARAAMYRAMMLGRKGELTAAQKNIFMRAGVMHLFAINGLHIGMVALALNAMLALLRCPRPVAATVVLAVLWTDVQTTGASPSAVRAFLMVAVLEAARLLRRPCNPVAALAASAIPTLLIDPLDSFGASFRMSYSVVLAILCLGLPFSAHLRRRFALYRYLPEVSWSRRQRATAFLADHLLSSAGVGVPAALVSALTGVQFFGMLTPCGVASNVLIVPLASLVIVAGCLTLVIPDPGGHAALLFNHAAGLLLGVIERLLRVIGGVPGAWTPAHFRAPWIGPASLALLLATVLAGYSWGWSPRRGGWWPPFAVVALALAAGVRYG